MKTGSNTVVYLVTGSSPNDRVQKVAQLREHFHNLTLVRRPGSAQQGDDAALVVNPIPNPVGLLRRAGLHRSATILDRVFFPNTAILYAKAVERRLRREIAADLNDGREVCLITCAPPHAVCMAGLKLKERYPRIKWIVDWQDLWSYDENYYLQVPKFYRPRVRRVEAEILRSADVNITTNTHARRVLEERYAADRVVAIPHHFSRAEFLDDQREARVSTESTDRPITIGFLGTLFKPPRVPGELLVDTIRQLRRSGNNVELHVHGGVPAVLEQDSVRLGQDGIKLHGYTTHAAGIKMLARYDFLLLLLADLPNSKAVMSIKLPHYILANRPILAVVPEQSAVAEIVRETGTGVVISAESDWTEQLKRALAAERASELPIRNEAAIERFSWDRISREWLTAICSTPDSTKTMERSVTLSAPAHPFVPLKSRPCEKTVGPCSH